MIELNVTNIRCGGCANTVRRVCASVDPKAQVQVDVSRQRVEIESAQAAEKFSQALSQAGFPAA